MNTQRHGAVTRTESCCRQSAVNIMVKQNVRAYWKFQDIRKRDVPGY